MEAERERQRGGQGTVLTAWPAGLWGLLRPFPNNRKVQPAFNPDGANGLWGRPWHKPRLRPGVAVLSLATHSV